MACFDWWAKSPIQLLPLSQLLRKRKSHPQNLLVIDFTVSTMNSTVYKPTTPPSHPSSLFPQMKPCKTIKDLKQVHAHMIKTAQMHDPLAAAEVLRFSALSDHRDVEYARKVFGQMPQPNCFSWNTIIRALAESDDGDEPLERTPSVRFTF
jgi:hypothetical protein